MLKDYKSFRAFGHIERFLRSKGYSVYTSDADGVGSIENNALQLKRQILKIIRESGAKKVNLIAHSKGGLDSRYMIEHLNMGKYVSSLTFLCTPHYGSEIATKLYSLPKPLRGWIAFWINFWYKLSGDKNPDVLTVCHQLRRTSSGVLPSAHNYGDVFLQSYSTVLEKAETIFLWEFLSSFQSALSIPCQTDSSRRIQVNSANTRAIASTNQPRTHRSSISL